MLYRLDICIDRSFDLDLKQNEKDGHSAQKIWTGSSVITTLYERFNNFYINRNKTLK